MAAIKTKIFDKKGNVIAPDSKFTGEELTFESYTELTPDARFSLISKGIRFYSYYCDHKTCMRFIADWMKANGWKAKDCNMVKSAGPCEFDSTTGKLARMLTRGLKSKKYTEMVKTSVESNLHRLRSLAELAEPPADKKPKRVSPAVRHRNKVDREVICIIDNLVESWCENPESIRGMRLDGLLTRVKAQPAVRKFIEGEIDTHLNLFYDAYEKKCKDAMEGLSFLSRPKLRKCVKLLMDLKNQVDEYYANRGKNKKPRKLDPSKVVKNLKYQVSDADLGLKSIDPIDILSSRILITYNTKNRHFGVLYAAGPAGLSVKGTSVVKTDESRSISVTLRKPEAVMETIKSIRTETDLRKFMKSLTTKPRLNKGRCADTTILIKTL